MIQAQEHNHAPSTAAGSFGSGNSWNGYLGQRISFHRKRHFYNAFCLYASNSWSKWRLTDHGNHPMIYPLFFMSITVCTGKLHCVWVTRADFNYEGSITIDPVLMEAAGIVPFQLLHINSMSNAVHWETYAIPGKRGSGDICLNGCPARLFQPGDKVIILSLEQMTRAEAAMIEHRVVHVDEKNKPVRIQIKKPSKLMPPQKARSR
jgi:aspartate 1-decarboxylase